MDDLIEAPSHMDVQTAAATSTPMKHENDVNPSIAHAAPAATAGQQDINNAQAGEDAIHPLQSASERPRITAMEMEDVDVAKPEPKTPQNDQALRNIAGPGSASQHAAAIHAQESCARASGLVKAEATVVNAEEQESSYEFNEFFSSNEDVGGRYVMPLWMKEGSNRKKADSILEDSLKKEEDVLQCELPRIKILTHVQVAEMAQEVVKKLRMSIDIQSDETAEEVLRTCHWDLNAAVLAFCSNDKPRRPKSMLWRRLSGDKWCAVCFERKDAGVVAMYTTDCGVSMCASCWGGYFCAMLGGGVRSPLLCPFPDCSSKVPVWLIEECIGFCDVFEDASFAAPLLEVYRCELASDFVQASENLVYCPSASCDRVLRVDVRVSESEFTCECGYMFCFLCLREAHLPAQCHTAREVTALLVQKEVERVAGAFRNLRRCGGCGILIENSDGCRSIKCSLCRLAQDWYSMDCCEASVLLSACERGKVREIDEIERLKEEVTCRLLVEAEIRSISTPHAMTHVPMLRSAARLAKWSAIAVIAEGKPHRSEAKTLDITIALLIKDLKGCGYDKWKVKPQVVQCETFLREIYLREGLLL